MEANPDGTLSIYIQSENKEQRRQLYTEIPVPFTAIHGMQTRAKDDCDVISMYTDNLDALCQQDFGQDDFYRRPSKSFVEEVMSRKISGNLLIATFAAAILQFLVGYNVVILNDPEKYVFPGHSVTAWSSAVAALAIGAPIGAAIGSQLSDGKGRWKTLMYAGLMFLVGGVVQTFAPSLTVLTGARFVIGIASGVSQVVVPVFIGELAPARLRGTLGTVNQFALVIGMLAAFLLSFIFATEEGWRYLLSMTVFVSLLQLLLLSQVPESPRWLLQQDHFHPDAEGVLKSLRVYEYEEDLTEEFSLYRGSSGAKGGDQQSNAVLFQELMAKQNTRFLFCCVAFLHAAKQLSGISAILYYSTSLFEGVIENPLVVTTLVGSVNVLFTYVALRLMDKCRRKSLLISSLIGMLCSCSCLILGQVGVFRGPIAIVAVNAYIAFYEIGIGPIPWLIIAEVFEAKYVAVIMSKCCQIGWIVNFAVGFMFPSLNDALGEYTFIPFACVLLISLFFVWRVLPETQGKTPIEIANEVEARLSKDTTNDSDPESGYTIFQGATLD